MSIRRFIGGVINQGQDEKIAYWFNTTEWGTNPSGVVVTVFDGETDVTSSVTAGSVVVAGDKITLPLIQNLAPGSRLRVEVLFVCAGNTFETYFDLRGEQ
jgi:hypothetical protein